MAGVFIRTKWFCILIQNHFQTTMSAKMMVALSNHTNWWHGPETNRQEDIMKPELMMETAQPVKLRVMRKIIVGTMNVVAALISAGFGHKVNVHKPRLHILKIQINTPVAKKV